MTQTDALHESFYDLFNQHFRRIDDPVKGTRYFSNIAIGAHTKPSRVDPNFQCVVVIKKSEVKNTPAPFLNRFEKYCITHRRLLNEALTHPPPYIRIIVEAAIAKACVLHLKTISSPFNKSDHTIYSSIECKCSLFRTHTQVQAFIECIFGPSSLYGLQLETLDSLVLSLLPPLTHSYSCGI